MADETTDGGQLPPAHFKLLAQYLKDLSFENPGSPHVLTSKGEAPRGQLKLDIQARTLAPMQYEVGLTLGITALRDQETVYIVELEYAGLVDVTDTPEEHVMPVLMIEAPRLLFPFARQVLANAIIDGGYRPVLLHPIDFVAVYRERMKRQQAGADPLSVPKA